MATLPLDSKTETLFHFRYAARRRRRRADPRDRGRRRARPATRRARRRRVARDPPLACHAPDVRRALRRLPPPGPDRHVRDLLGPRGHAGGLVLRARPPGLDSPLLPAVFA